MAKIPRSASQSSGGHWNDVPDQSEDPKNHEEEAINARCAEAQIELFGKEGIATLLGRKTSHCQVRSLRCPL